MMPILVELPAHIALRAFTGSHMLPFTRPAPPAQVYHTKRMQRVFAVRFSGDGSYVFSGEAKGALRLGAGRGAGGLGGGAWGS